MELTSHLTVIQAETVNCGRIQHQIHLNTSALSCERRKKDALIG